MVSLHMCRFHVYVMSCRTPRSSVAMLIFNRTLIAPGLRLIVPTSHAPTVPNSFDGIVIVFARFISFLFSISFRRRLHCPGLRRHHPGHHRVGRLHRRSRHRCSSSALRSSSSSSHSSSSSSFLFSSSSSSCPRRHFPSCCHACCRYPRRLSRLSRPARRLHRHAFLLIVVRLVVLLVVLGVRFLVLVLVLLVLPLVRTLETAHGHPNPRKPRKLNSVLRQCCATDCSLLIANRNS